MWKKLFVFFLGVFSVAALAAQPMADKDALVLLKKIAKTSAQTSFQGIYLQQHGDYVETIRICRIVENGVVGERREALDGPAHEMVRHGDQISVYLPEGAQLKNFDPSRNHHLFPNLLPDNPSNILANYQLRRRGVERVADIEADVFDLLPRDELRYAHRLWLHPQTGLLLKVMTYGENNEVFDLYAFSNIEIGKHIDKKLLQPSRPMTVVTVVDRKAPSVNPWRVDGVPSGFKLEREALRQMRGKEELAIHHFYTDGMVSVSVFLDKMQAKLPIGGARQGVLSIFSKQEGNAHLTVLGEVPPKTVELFAKAYKLAE